MSEWQPIETAPRSGKAILVWVPNNLCVYCVNWYQPQGVWQIFGGEVRAQLALATHWMPTPKPPEQTQDSRQPHTGHPLPDSRTETE